LQAIESLETVDYARKADVFDSLVGNCMSCHQALCPGPMVKIKKLY